MERERGRDAESFATMGGESDFFLSFGNEVVTCSTFIILGRLEQAKIKHI